MKINVLKLWKGKIVSVKSYQLEEALKKRQNLEIHHFGEVMTIPWNEIMEKGVVSVKHIQSKINRNQFYDLVDFIWKPDKNNNLMLPL
ncbi:hypothetical protein M0R04_06195 [Candidatus Dojkabacteria bacterium]|jgi:hypothetical protein|nr:hypothetical protein [Candidatus Dojkabacteria bacterium]